MFGAKDIVKAFEQEIGCKVGNVTEDGMVGLYHTACIGMSDQEPAAIINDKIFTSLTPARVKEIVADMKAEKAVEAMYSNYGDGQNSSDLIKSMVNSNIKRKGAVLFADYESGSAVKKAVSMDPDAVVEEVKTSQIRGRGGAGFPTGLKWDFCKKSGGDTRYVLCNADEGEPGTFKDRVIMTELPNMLFDGMVVAGYALEAKEGILYLRNEYKYLEAYLENVLQKMRDNNLLGNNICGKDGFNYDIRIQFGAGAYICGEESALIESCEGKRGEPRNRPPFPVQKGYLQKPTVINNVETFSAVVQIINKGGEWFTMLGSKETTGTKVISVSGDCKNPGIYEVEWGTRIRDVIEMAGGEDLQAVQVAGPSGICIGPKEFKRTICYEDFPTGGSLILIGKNRDLLKDVVSNFMEFFMDESCGSCVPCRSLPEIMKAKLDKIINGKGVMQDIDDLVSWGELCKNTTRCGLGQTAANPILTTIVNFRDLYEGKVNKDIEYLSEFDLSAAVAESCEAAGRNPQI